MGHQMLAYGILMILSFVGFCIQTEFPTKGYSLIAYVDPALGLWMIILAIVKMVTLPSEEEEAAAASVQHLRGPVYPSQNPHYVQQHPHVQQQQQYGAVPPQFAQV